MMKEYRKLIKTLMTYFKFIRRVLIPSYNLAYRIKRNLRASASRFHTPSSRKPTVVVVSFIPPFPLEHGGNRQVIHSLLIWLRKNGYHICFVYQQRKNNQADKEKFAPLVDELFLVADYIKKPDSKRYRDPRKAYPETSLILKELCKRVSVVAVIAEYVNIAQCLSVVPDDILTMIHTHDMFSRIAEQRKPLGVSTDGLEMTPEQERSLLLHAKLIIALQPNEAKLFKELVPERDVIVLGHTTPALAQEDSTYVTPNTLLLVGGGNPVNRHGFSLFLEHAWPKIVQEVPDCELRVVGTIGEVVSAGTPNSTVLGRLPDLRGEYARAALVINPVLLGTGLKIKTIEALCHGKALVSTASGVEGLEQNVSEGKAWLASDDWDQFADLCIDVLKDEALRKRLEKSAHAYAKTYLSEEVVFEELSKTLIHATQHKKNECFPLLNSNEISIKIQNNRNHGLVVGLLSLHDKCLLNIMDRIQKNTYFDYALFPVLRKNKYKINNVYLLPDFYYNILSKKCNVEYGVYNLLSINEKRYVDALIEELNCKLDFGAYLFFYTYKYFSAMIEKYKPQYIFLWCQFNPLPFGLEYVARINNIQIVYFEYGLIPGTLNISFSGQVGYSELCTKNDAFNTLSITNSDVDHAEDVINTIKTKKISRYPKSNISNRIIYIPSNKKIILYAGINDFHSGIIPYDKKAHDFQSPYFLGTLNALDALRIACVSNPDWHIIFKPHPVHTKEKYRYQYQRYKSYPQITVVEDGDISEWINYADLCVTILSQSSYIFCIEDKPSILLGNSEIRGKGCVYEYDGGDLTALIRMALEHGYTKDQKRSFEEHVARLLKYALFTDGESSWGRSLSSLQALIENRTIWSS